MASTVVAGPKKEKTIMRRNFVIAVAAAALVGATALPASAATGDTGTNFVLGVGALSMTVPATATLTPATVGATTVSGSLGLVSVSDQRGAATGWIVNAVSANFLNGAVASGAVTYSAGTATVDGVVFTPAGPTVITGSLPVGTGAATGSNTASFNPTITVALPLSGNVIGTYVGTVTTSIA